ncbi:ABC-three component system protein [Isoptericola sediminis]|uniref:ABC-three component systems C-terminal domain-containing protein n=1 Tax=Isoptericola sediminis TaxID=2733572 RepID=A0A849K4U1_9MICO|nr:ABC-three component system protein [Isoptericola sediminis]NNU26167.1 hypothetical protein [Isoptericola sediminis]
MAMGTNRDDIPAAQARVVYQRSGGRCAYPGCGAELVMDAISPGDQPKSTGKVAHIAAASPGGPRYDASMTRDQRRSANNLIYLCGPHHDAIDFQLDHHTREFLTEAKLNHERAVARATRAALGNVTNYELDTICSTIASAPSDQAIPLIDPPVEVREKIELNDLGAASREKIRDGLSQSARVAAFIAFQGTYSRNFGQRLVARFKADYYAARADGLDSDEVFDYLIEQAYENAGPTDTPEIRAAALAVITHLFEICEIFERA